MLNIEQSAALQYALDSNYREKASFLKDNILPIQESGHLNFINRGEKFQNFLMFYLWMAIQKLK